MFMMKLFRKLKKVSKGLSEIVRIYIQYVYTYDFFRGVMPLWKMSITK